MPLYDVTNANEVLVRPSDAESYEVLQAVKRKTLKVTFDKITRTVDQAVDSVKPTNKSKLIWTRSAALFGHGSMQPKANVDHVWDNVIAAVGDDKQCLRAVGGLLRWRISLRDETWLVYRRKDVNGRLDPDTGKVISISEYWIDENYKQARQIKKAMDLGTDYSAGPLRASMADLGKLRDRFKDAR